MDQQGPGFHLTLEFNHSSIKLFREANNLYLVETYKSQSF